MQRRAVQPRNWGTVNAIFKAICTVVLLAWPLSGLPALAQPQPHQLRLASAISDHTPWAEALQRWKKAVEQRTAGRVQIRLFLDGQLGSEAEVLRRCQRGELEAVASSAQGMAALVPEVATLQLWYLFKHVEESHRLIDTALAAPFSDAFAAAGLQLGWWLESGERHLASRERPISSPSDLKGMRLYARDAAAPHSPWRALGVQPAPLALGQVLGALQAGGLDGFDQTLLFAVTARWHSAIRHWTLTGHAHPPGVIGFSQPWFAGLPADLQVILVEEGKVAQDFARQRVRQLGPTLLGAVKATGAQVAELTPADRAAFEKVALAARVQFRKKAAPAAVRMLDLIEAAQRKAL
jgi:TRAP-type C4-dicarboxylate transport system substrate-binding protein